MGVVWKFINIKVCLTPFYIAKNRHGKENNYNQSILIEKKNIHDYHDYMLGKPTFF